MHSGFLRPYSSRISILQRLLDGALIFSVYAAMLFFYGRAWQFPEALVVMSVALAFALIAELRGLYSSWRINSLVNEVREVIFVWAMAVFLLLMLGFASQSTDLLSRFVVGAWFVLVPIAMISMRLFIRSFLHYLRRHGANVRSVAIVGNNAVGHKLLQHIVAMPWVGLSIHGVFDTNIGDETSVRFGEVSYYLGKVDGLIQKVRSGEVDSVFVALPIRSERRIEELVNQFSDSTVSVYVVPDLFISELMRSRWVDFGGMPLVSVYETPFYGLYGWVKRIEDILLAGVILLLISPLMVAIAFAVKATSSGTVFFKQRRYGLNGAVVEVWKFRSMTVCEDGPVISQAKKGDARITPLGAFLRRTSLDELPQFFNVLQGSMSVVGPRPHAVAHNEQYRKLIKGYMLRHKVKPGITGWAQVNGWRGETDTLDKMSKRVEYDLEYIQNWSLWLDLKIVFLTVFRGFGGKNAY